MKKALSIQNAFNKFEIFIKLAKLRAKKNPLIVVVLMHEYFRNIYPDDPFISRRLSSDHLENIIT